MFVQKTIEFLRCHQAKYEVTAHPSASRTLEASSSKQRSPTSGLTRTVLVNVDGELAMMLIPGNHRPRLDMLKDLIDAQTVRLPEDQEVHDVFPDCEIDAIPPFGTLDGMRVFVDETVTRNPMLAFSLGCGTEVVEMLYGDYARLVRPLVAPLAAPNVEAKPRMMAQRSYAGAG